MLNHNKRLIKSKSKILLLALCIFGLVFSYSCNCRNNSTAPDNTDPSTFSIGEATGNVKASIVQSAKVIGEIKIGFDASHEYTTEFTVEDSDTTETTKLTETDFTLSGNVLSLNDSGLGKVRAIDSSSQPTSKTITINFTLKANDPSLKNSTQTLPVEVKLTHAQKITTGKDGIENTILTDALKIQTLVINDGSKSAAFEWKDNDVSISTVDVDNKTVTIKDITGVADKLPSESISYAKLQETAAEKLPNGKFGSNYNTYFNNHEFTWNKESKTILAASIKFIPKDEYEFTDPTATLKFELVNGGEYSE